ncbi:TMEM164 family acyltransferase [Spiroplasma chrysopicola]|uniref:Uncharacterized protein n=1 Tax=Spiroplasma chrysopicola DF-1 TaxID=1276227 RepID=R4U4N1_9MOLU|nr:YwaF family protein [Spiroplasma chrysopicola]AGM25523.1 hypothetical protein SCHRY_v1c09510 [Spiroplasma chrysopicola DF-1]
MTTFYWLIAIVLIVFACLSLNMFPKFYAKTTKKLYLRGIILILIIIVQVSHFISYAMEKGFNNIISYFYLQVCTITSFALIILLIYPKKIFLECFGPLAITGPLFALAVPLNYYPSSFWYYEYYFGHGLITYGYLYVYWYGITNYKFDHRTVSRSVIILIIIYLCAELFNNYFGTEYILDTYWYMTCLFPEGWHMKEWSRPAISAVFFFVIGPVVILIGVLPLWFFKPIYDLQQNQFLHPTWSNVAWAKIKKRKKPSNKVLH